MTALRLADGATHVPGTGRAWARPATTPGSRIAFAAAHVVPRTGSDTAPGAAADLDWEATLAFRRHLWSYGLGVAEAMDTAQRGMGLDWPAAEELIRRSSAEARDVGGRVAAGVGTDHLVQARSLDDVRRAYEEQLAVVEEAGAQPILMASRALAACANGPDDYAKVYGRLLEQASGPVILHWLGPMFDPALHGYWGSDDVATATRTFVEIIADRAGAVDGVKVSLLDQSHEERLRRLLPEGVRVYTGDDFNYPELILGDGERHSHALLGAFAAIAPIASAALVALDRGDEATYRELIEPTLPLSRHLFETPTYHYKAGIAFLAWLAGHQPGYVMVGGLHAARSAAHLSTAYRLADGLGLFPDPELAARRMRTFLLVAGVDQ